ncbi:cysteine desulfurase family protein [Liquorilactobacillus vini]|uniref:cysteine desulfurase family protein n=1 Tax=Liquorilactobacillus vini TaxID=238015 RepID=UPI000300E5E4|nr:cysteine desulfurase family protein [Liquorilactobacillus vini]
MKHIYLDNAGTTPMAPEVIKTMTIAMEQTFGNASSTHFFGRQARKVLDESRQIIAKSINAKRDDQIVFTSGGTESDNTAVVQTALARQHEGKHLITTAVEHEAILKPMKYLESLGFEVTYLPVDHDGLISLDDLRQAIRPDTILVSIMTGNNEVGSHFPIHEIGQIVAESNAWFHTDAVQAYGLLDFDVQADRIDLLSTSAHKLNGPKFLGFLYRSDRVKFSSMIKGGDQELKRRAGTENVPAIAGFAKAVSLLDSAAKQAKRQKFIDLQQRLLEGLQKNGVEFEVNGGQRPDKLPHVLNLWFKGCPALPLLTNLDLNGIAASAGSACTAGSIDPSHVLLAIYGKDSPRLNESLRFSFGFENTVAEINYTVQVLAKTIKKLKRG